MMPVIHRRVSTPRLTIVPTSSAATGSRSPGPSWSKWQRWATKALAIDPPLTELIWATSRFNPRSTSASNAPTAKSVAR